MHRDLITASVGVALLLLAGGCEGEAGGNGQPCYPNGTCDSPYVCDDGVCAEEEGSVQTGSLGHPCYPNGTCNSPYTCSDGTCVEESERTGDLGQPCYPNGTCNSSHICDEGTCVEGPAETWTDPTTGLTWQLSPSEQMSRTVAGAYCEELTLAGGGWHLPTISELRTLLRGCPATVEGGTCNLGEGCLAVSCMDESCVSTCDAYEGPGPNGCYWPDEMPSNCGDDLQSSSRDEVTGNAWYVYFARGDISQYGTAYRRVICVR